MAQKIIKKHDISSSKIEDTKEVDDIQEGNVTVFKTLFWWERKLARIISDNFKVDINTWIETSTPLSVEEQRRRRGTELGKYNFITWKDEPMSIEELINSWFTVRSRFHIIDT